jgi:hypothetical protein
VLAANACRRRSGSVNAVHSKKGPPERSLNFSAKRGPTDFLHALLMFGTRLAHGIGRRKF